MKLNKFTWNNGTQNSPIVLTTDQINKLIAISKRTDILTNISGYITTTTGKIKKALKYSLEQQCPNINIIVDEELYDNFQINVNNTTINEGTSVPINITGDNSISHSNLLWHFNYKNFSIDGDISEANIKSRIRITNGQIVVDPPQENASWEVEIEITAYPSYYEDTEFSSIPPEACASMTVTVVAEALTRIDATVNQEYNINSEVTIDIKPVPATSNKLTGCTITYSTTTPNLISIENNTIKTKNETGTASVTITVDIFGIESQTKVVSFTVINLQPVTYFINQWSYNTDEDPDIMVTGNYIKQNDGTFLQISTSGKTGNPTNNVITWLKNNTHAYVGKTIDKSFVKLKQLKDDDRTFFIDGTSAISYISNTSGDYNVFIKFPTDIYYKVESAIRPGETEIDNNYVAITISTYIPENENKEDWEKYSKYNLIGAYKGYEANNNVYCSISGIKPKTSISYSTIMNYIKNAGQKFNITNYATTKLLHFLFYGYYSSLDSQKHCGYGTINYDGNSYWPKITGLTNKLCMIDTDSSTGTGTNNGNDTNVVNGYGDTIKSVNFWGLENYWGELNEYISDLKTLQAGQINETNDKLFLTGALNKGKTIVATDINGITNTYTSASNFVLHFYSYTTYFVCIMDNTNNIIRAIQVPSANGYGKQLIFGKYGDIFAKSLIQSSNLRFCDWQQHNGGNRVMVRGGYSNDYKGGINYFNYATAGSTSGTTTFRIMYEGDENTVRIIGNNESL